MTAEAGLHIEKRMRRYGKKTGARVGLAWLDAFAAVKVWYSGDIKRATVLMRKAAEKLENVPMIYDAARLRRQLAGRLADLGDRDASLEELRRVHEVFQRIGAEPELKKTRGMFRELDTRPPSISKGSGAEALSQRELEIARLVARRKSNKAIAKELGISPRTVSTHLSNTFQKLEIGSRGELADYAREHSLLSSEAGGLTLDRAWSLLPAPGRPPMIPVARRHARCRAAVKAISLWDPSCRRHRFIHSRARGVSATDGGPARDPDRGSVRRGDEGDRSHDGTELSRMLRTLCYLLAISALACGGGNGLSESTGSDGAARAESLSPEALAAIAHQALWEPSASDLAVQAPDSFLATFETSAGDFVVAFYRDWAPLGVDRVYHLTRYDFFAGARFFRVNPGLVQFGLRGEPPLDSIWADLTIPDDPLVGSNTRGTVSFAKAGPGSRNTQLFINRQDNPIFRHMLCRRIPSDREGGERYGRRGFLFRRSRRDTGDVPGLDHGPRQRVPGPAVSAARHHHEDPGGRARRVAGGPPENLRYPISSATRSHSDVRSADLAFAASCARSPKPSPHPTVFVHNTWARRKPHRSWSRELPPPL